VVNSPTNVAAGRQTNITGPTYNTAVNRSPTVNNVNAMGSGVNRPYSGSYGGWYNGGWGGFSRSPAAWGGVAAAGGAAAALSPWASGGSSFEYANPYYDSSSATSGATADASSSTTVSPTIVVQPALDYSQPIAVPTQTEVANTDAAVVDDGMDSFSKARSYFMDGKYAEAMAEAERALKLLSGDRTIHEFRALCLFAQKRYKEAAAALYAVVAAGPGWDWKTMSALYPDNDTYTAQLRALEQFVKDNPKDAQGRFLLGYHYTVLDDRDAAAEQFRLASELQPKDKLSAQLADALAAKAPEATDGKE
jgi:tetratricopeptide (TPR) repeat protein